MASFAFSSIFLTFSLALALSASLFIWLVLVGASDSARWPT